MSVELVTRTANFGQAIDRELFVKWVFETEQNLFDRKVMFYPTTNTLMVEKVDSAAVSIDVACPWCLAKPGDPCLEVPEGQLHLARAAAEQKKPEIFIPFQATVTIESIAARPGITPREMALALRKWHDGIEEVCQRLRIREIYFVVEDELVAEFALRHGYTEINGERGKPGDPAYVAGLAKWAKEHGYPGKIKRVLKMKLPGPEDKLPANQRFAE